MQHIISRSLDREIRVPLHLDEAETCIARPRAARLHHTRASEPAMNIGRPADGPAKLDWNSLPALRAPSQVSDTFATSSDPQKNDSPPSLSCLVRGHSRPRPLRRPDNDRTSAIHRPLRRRQQQALPQVVDLHSHRDVPSASPLWGPVHRPASDPAARHPLHRRQQRAVPVREHLHADHVLDAGPTRRRAVHRDADDHVADRAAVPDPLHHGQQRAVLGREHVHADDGLHERQAVRRRVRLVSHAAAPDPVHYGEQRAVLDGEHLHAYDGVYPGDAVRRSVYSDGYVGCLFAGGVLDGRAVLDTLAVARMRDIDGSASLEEPNVQHKPEPMCTSDISHRTRFLGEWACSATDLAAIFIESLTVAAVAFSDEERLRYLRDVEQLSLHILPVANLPRLNVVTTSREFPSAEKSECFSPLSVPPGWRPRSLESRQLLLHRDVAASDLTIRGDTLRIAAGPRFSLTTARVTGAWAKGRAREGRSDEEIGQHGMVTKVTYTRDAGARLKLRRRSMLLGRQQQQGVNGTGRRQSTTMG
ncbi:hypothetical protein PCL_05977 [Purpureocillium lilacinum]|uniref:Uncharacterized protein n=1 Tax=Purpureocillium lilacinum TaxID=33203 RepID=A0A2U3ELD1_PURLI|nr:hypothetical protein PCL_05977 [Purpureocillium lilacinum]